MFIMRVIYQMIIINAELKEKYSYMLFVGLSWNWKMKALTPIIGTSMMKDMNTARMKLTQGRPTRLFGRNHGLIICRMTL